LIRNFDLLREIDVKLHLNKTTVRYFLSSFAFFAAGTGTLTLLTLESVPVSARQSAASAPAQAGAGDSQSSHSDFPAGEGRDAFLRVCSKCHTPTIVLAYGQKREGWENTITKMVRLGAQGTDEDFTDISDYLTASFPPSSIPKIFVNKATDQQFADMLGITSDEAKAIIAYRDKVGGFKSLDDLKKTPGIDTKKVDAKKENLVF
jgi:competence protein ComEA